MATLVISGLFLVKGPVSAGSALLGGLVFILPNAYFTSRAFRFQGARSAKKIVHSIYKAEVIKLASTAFLFVLVFYFIKPLDPFGLFAAFIGTQAVSWVAAARLTHKPQQHY